MPICAHISYDPVWLGSTLNTNEPVYSPQNAVTLVVDGVGQCDPDQLTVLTQTELQAVIPGAGANPPSPFNLDIESAVAIGGAILLLWAVAFVLRMARKSVESQGE